MEILDGLRTSHWLKYSKLSESLLDRRGEDSEMIKFSQIEYQEKKLRRKVSSSNRAGSGLDEKVSSRNSLSRLKLVHSSHILATTFCTKQGNQKYLFVRLMVGLKQYFVIFFFIYDCS